jgi:hypothetical protein
MIFLVQSVNDAKLVYTYQSSVYAGKPVGEPTEFYVQGVQVRLISL